MKLKVVLCIVIICLMSSVAFAAPLTDYKLGKTAVDLTYYPDLDYRVTNEWGFDHSAKSKMSNWDFGVTTGLGDKFAVQYRQFNPEVKRLGPASENITVDSKEANLLYRLDKNFAVFAGYHWGKYTTKYYGTTYKAENNAAQYGLIASQKIADKTTLYGLAGFGSGYRNYEVGLGYALTPKLDFNLLYRDMKADELGSPSIAARVKGLGAGLTYTF
ncbi:MAG: hypothetical protein K0Q77_2885 [Anaerosporomusa subterranea]|nr:hypothetical protein [Anaerosporomusa subterranea]